jgi:alpha-ketoglutarate-dependent 2,4-dichlorophenoxyacetate dioxygenase
MANADQSVKNLHPLFGAELIGSDLTCPDEALATRVKNAIGRYGVLLFRDSGLDDQGLAALAKAFGPLQNMSPDPGVANVIGRVANVDESGALLPDGHDRRRNQDANSLWHMDSTYLSPGATYSFLLAMRVPSQGGDTEFCDLRAAFDRLPSSMRARLRYLTADHSIFHSRRLVGYDMGRSPAKLPPVRRSLIRKHRPSDRDALIIASHVERIVGLSPEETRSLVEELVGRATEPDLVYRHQWRAGDLLMWDNRCMMHRASPYSSFDGARDMRSVRVVDGDDEGVVFQESVSPFHLVAASSR